MTATDRIIKVRLRKLIAYQTPQELKSQYEELDYFVKRRLGKI